MNADENGFSPNDMTPEGWKDYTRAKEEIVAQRRDRKSRYNGVARVHCPDGYVDAIWRHAENGASTHMRVNDYREHVKKGGGMIYDYVIR